MYIRMCTYIQTHIYSILQRSNAGQNNHTNKKNYLVQFLHFPCILKNIKSVLSLQIHILQNMPSREKKKQNPIITIISLAIMLTT